MASRLPHRRSLPVSDAARSPPKPSGCRGRSIRRSASPWTCRSVWKVPSGAICTLSLSFNNKGPLGTFFRYICDNGTFIARYDDLYDGEDKKIDLAGVAVSNNGIELIDREFVAAIREKREPNASVAQCLPAMRTLDRIERAMR